MWIWAALLDLKAHAFKGHEFHAWGSSEQLALLVAITLVTAASFYLNAVFAFAISQPGKPEIRPAFTLVRKNLAVVLGIGAVVGVALGVSAIVVPRWGTFWFTLVARDRDRRDDADLRHRPRDGSPGSDPSAPAATSWPRPLIGGTLGALICTPPYVIGRIGILLLGSQRLLFVLGVILLVVGTDPPGRRHRRREGDQDEREARRGQGASFDGALRQALTSRKQAAAVGTVVAK